MKDRHVRTGKSVCKRGGEDHWSFSYINSVKEREIIWGGKLGAQLVKRLLASPTQEEWKKEVKRRD